MNDTQRKTLTDTIFPKKPGADRTARPPIGIPRIALGTMIGILLALGVCSILRSSLNVDIYVPVRQTLSAEQQKELDRTLDDVDTSETDDTTTLP